MPTGRDHRGPGGEGTLPPPAGGPATPSPEAVSSAAKADALREEIAALKEELATMRRDFSTSRSAEIVEANERLVQAALRAGRIAETAVNHLDALPRDDPREVSTEAPGQSATAAQFDQRLRDLREANERLVIAGLAAQRLYEQARDENSRQIKFLAIVAHELRNPLHPILTVAEILSRGPVEGPDLTRVQSILTRQVTHLSRLVDDLLDGSLASVGAFRVERGPAEIQSIVNDAVETCHAAIEAKGQALSLDLPEAPLRVSGDSVRLAQVFGNLLNNASKYTPAGGAIRLAAAEGEKTVTVTVSDNGIGITAEALPNIFELFARGASEHELRHDGLGIGLAVVRELVEAHGGTVKGSSEGSGRGSEFVVTLPKDDTPERNP